MCTASFLLAFMDHETEASYISPELEQHIQRETTRVLAERRRVRRQRCLGKTVIGTLVLAVVVIVCIMLFMSFK